jgi:hypothetical protein
MPTPRAIPVRIGLLLIVALATLCAQAQAESVVLLNTDLTMQRAELVGIADDVVTIIDTDQRTARVPIERIAIVSAEIISLGTLPAQPMIDRGPDNLDPEAPGVTRESIENEQSPVFVDLIDGQRLRVTVASSDDPEVLVGIADGFGPVRIPLERILRVARPGAPEQPTPALSDRVVLGNGDTLAGFVAAIGSSVRIESEVGVTEIPIGRVAEIHLANPPEPTPGVLVRDTTGTVLLAQSFSVDADRRLRITTESAPLGIDSDGQPLASDQRSTLRFAGMRVVRPDQHVRSLAAVPPARVTPTGGRRWTPDPEHARATAAPAELGDVFLPAPASVRYEIPRGASRFATEITHRGGAWTACTVLVQAEQRDASLTLLGSFEIDAFIRTESIDSRLPDDTVAIILTVEPGLYGAVQDAIVFGKPRLLIRD